MFTMTGKFIVIFTLDVFNFCFTAILCRYFFFFPAHLFQEPKIGVSVNVFYVPMSFKQMWFFLLPKLDIRHAES